MISVVVTSGSDGGASAVEDQLSNLSTCISNYCKQNEVIFVVTDARPFSREFCERLVTRYANIRIVVSERPLDASLGAVMGIGNAIGDQVVVTSVANLCLDEIREGLDYMSERDVDLVRFLPPMKASWFRWNGMRLLGRMAYRVVNGTAMLRHFPTTQVLNRDTARFLGRTYDAESRMYRTIPAPHLMYVDRESRSLHGGQWLEKGPLRARKALRLITTSEAGTLRIVAGVGILGAAFAVLVGGLAAWSYLFRDDVMPGWTSLAFGIAAIALFQTMFAFVVAEYIIAVYRGLPSSNRIQAVRTYRSARTPDSSPNILVVGRSDDGALKAFDA